MREYILQKIRQFLREIRRQKVLRRVVSILAAIVVFITSYALILPAITMERKTAEQDPGILLDADTEVQNQEADTAGQTESGLAVMPAVSGSAVTLSASGDGYRIEVASIVDESFPAGSVLETREIATGSTEYDIYLQRTEEQFPDGVAAARFFDISIRDQSGNKIQPAVPVEVRIMLDAPENATGSAIAVHFEEQEIQPVIEQELLEDTMATEAGMRLMAAPALESHPLMMKSQMSFGKSAAASADVLSEGTGPDCIVDLVPTTTEESTDARQIVSFTATGFSVYGIVYTIDIGSGDKTYTMPYDTTIAFSELIDLLELKAPGTSDRLTIDMVENLVFSDPSLMTITQVESGDWELKSIAPFLTRQTLTVYLADGTSFNIQFTGISSKIDVNNHHIIYTVDQNGYHVLKTDGSVETFTAAQCQQDEDGKIVTFDKLDSNYRWIFHYVYTEYDRPETLNYQFYFIRPADDSSASIALNSPTATELIQYGTNNIAVLPVAEGEGFHFTGYNDTSLYYDGTGSKPTFKPDTNASVINIYSQEPLPAYDFYVESNEVEETDPDKGPRGYVAGTDERGEETPEKTTAFITKTIQTGDADDKRNQYAISAVLNPDKREKNEDGTPKPNGQFKFLFDHWELNGDTIYKDANGAYVMVSEGHRPPENAVLAGDTIPESSLTIPYNSSRLTAHFILNPHYVPTKEEKEGRYIDKKTLEEWIAELKTKNLPLDKKGTTKTAEVYDYENRIYRVDITAQSSLATFTGDIDMGFIIDVSPSMLFPAHLGPAMRSYNTNQQIGEQKISDININNNWRRWGLDTGETYYFITDKSGTATVCELYWNNNNNDNKWVFLDASKRRQGNPYDPATTTGVSHYHKDDPPYMIYTAVDLVKEEDLIAGSKSLEILQKFNLARPGAIKNRAYYLELSLYNTIQTLKEIKGILSMAETGTQNKDVRIAWNTFKNALPNNNPDNLATPGYNVSRQPNFTPVEQSTINLEYDYSGGGTSTDIALLDAAGKLRYDIANDESIRSPYYTGTPHNNSHSSYGRWLKKKDETYNQRKAAGTLYVDYSTLGFQGFNWDQSHTKYAILITDGAPQRGGVDIESSLVEDAADELKKKGDANSPLHLITIGLGMGDVEKGKALLYDIASPNDDDYYPMFYNAEAGNELQYALYDTIKAILKKAIVKGDIVDSISEAFYPIDLKDGSPLAAGNVIDLYGEKIADSEANLTATQKAAGYGIVRYDNQTGIYTIKWSEQEFTWDPWHGTVYVKAKEDLLGGNAVNTNSSGAKVEATHYKAEGSGVWVPLKAMVEEGGNGYVETYDKIINLPSPKVNVNELAFNGNETTWTVYLGTEVDPKEELKRLYDAIKVSEVVTQANDQNLDGLPDTIIGSNHYYDPPEESITDDREKEDESNKVTFTMNALLLHLIKGRITARDTTRSDWTSFITKDEEQNDILNWDYFLTEAMKENGIVIPYREYGINDNSNVKITLTKNVLSGEEADFISKSPHTTTVVNGTDKDGVTVPAERYDLTIVYSPDYDVLPEGQGGKSTADFHTGTYGTMYQGHAAGTETSRNAHTINVFAKGIEITKVDQDDTMDYPSILKNAEFKLYRSTRAEEVERTDLYTIDGENYTPVATLDTKATGVAEYKWVEQLKTGEEYYLVETKTPDGYNTIDPILVTLGITDQYIPQNDPQSFSETRPENDFYTWNQTAVLQIGVMADNTKVDSVKRTDQRNEEGYYTEDLTQTTIVRDSTTATQYYSIINNQGLTLPETGGSGRDTFTAAGIILIAMAVIAAILWRRTQFRVPFPKEEGG